MFRFTLRWLTPMAFIICFSSGVIAEESKVIEEVIVTATKRASTIQEVPFSINAQTQDDIQQSGATNLEELSRNVAGLTVQNLGPGQSQIAVRGVSAGQIVRDQPGVKEQVGVYLDESVISLSLFTPDLDLYDLNRVETLRGPQGTLFGSGSVGGTIRYITNQPNLQEKEGSVEVQAHSLTDGEAGGHVKGMINIPFGDGTAALRVVGYTTQYAGFMDALGENGSKKEDVNGGFRDGGRIALTFKPSDNLSITPRFIFQDIEVDGFNRQEVYNLYANPNTTTRPAIQLGEREQYLLRDEKFSDVTKIFDLNVGWALEDVDITFVYSNTDREILVSRDASALTGSVTVDLGFPDAAVLIPSNLRDTTEVDQSTVELRISSNDDGDWQWLAGFFMSDTERTYAQRLPTPGYDSYVDAAFGAGTSAAVSNGYPDADSPYNSDLPYDLEQTAFFGEVTYDISTDLHLTVGGRFYDYEEERRFTSGGLFSNGDDQVDKTDSDGFTPRVLLSYNMSEQSTINAQVSQGFRLGGVNDPLNAGLCSPGDLTTFGGFQDYEDETLWNYEAGIKTKFDNGFTLNAAVFYADIEDLQVTLDAGTCSSRISFNVPEAHSSGIEFELGGQLTDNLDVSVAGSFLKSEFDSTVLDGGGNIVGGVEKGNRLASVPEMQLAATLIYNFNTQLFDGSDGYVAMTIHHVGDRITQPGDQVAGAGDFVSGLPFGGATGTDITSVDLELDAYTLVNLSAGIVKSDWEAVVFVSNLTDENADLSFDRERGGRARLSFRTNQPRTFGITFRKFY